MSIATQHT